MKKRSDSDYVKFINKHTCVLPTSFMKTKNNDTGVEEFKLFFEPPNHATGDFKTKTELETTDENGCHLYTRVLSFYLSSSGEFSLKYLDKHLCRGPKKATRTILFYLNKENDMIYVPWYNLCLLGSSSKFVSDADQNFIYSMEDNLEDLPANQENLIPVTIDLIELALSKEGAKDDQILDAIKNLLKHQPPKPQPPKPQPPKPQPPKIKLFPDSNFKPKNLKLNPTSSNQQQIYIVQLQPLKWDKNAIKIQQTNIDQNNFLANKPLTKPIEQQKITANNKKNNKIVNNNPNQKNSNILEANSSEINTNENNNNQDNKHNLDKSKQDKQKQSYFLPAGFAGGAAVGGILAIILRDNKVGLIIVCCATGVSAMASAVTFISTYQHNKKVNNATAGNSLLKKEKGIGK